MNSRGYPSMTALLGLLAVLGYQNRDKIADLLRNMNQGGGAAAGDNPAQGQQGGLGNLGGLLGGLSAGTLLNGGLSELLDQFTQSGQRDAAESWIGTGPNKDVAPTDLKKALSPDVLQQLSQATGLSQDELLSRLSRELPAAVDKYTPEGRIVAA
ncbi:MAG: YidB family protein [Pseudorhodoplanes sp.]|jgi:uncharacterized protein YidB (DUF937 family)|nr:YidB family protein [Pseudorhodoplanes sp.]